MMIDSQRIEDYTRKILTINAVGDIFLGLPLILLPAQFANIIGFTLSNEIGYLAGGWGVATLALGLTRLYAARGTSEIVYFTALFGLVEGTMLALYGVGYSFVSGIPFSKTSLSTFFALTFAIAYGRVLYLRTRNKTE